MGLGEKLICGLEPYVKAFEYAIKNEFNTSYLLARGSNITFVKLLITKFENDLRLEKTSEETFKQILEGHPVNVILVRYKIKKI